MFRFKLYLLTLTLPLFLVGCGMVTDYVVGQTFQGERGRWQVMTADAVKIEFGESVPVDMVKQDFADKVAGRGFNPKWDANVLQTDTVKVPTVGRAMLTAWFDDNEDDEAFILVTGRYLDSEEYTWQQIQKRYASGHKRYKWLADLWIRTYDRDQVYPADIGDFKEAPRVLAVK